MSWEHNYVYGSQRELQELTLSLVHESACDMSGHRGLHEVENHLKVWYILSTIVKFLKSKQSIYFKMCIDHDYEYSNEAEAPIVDHVHLTAH